MNQNKDWVDYWDGDVSIYVSKRHLEAHYRGLFADIAPLLPAAPFTLLDYGCGEALMAPEIAARGGRVILFDQAGARRPKLRRRFAANPAIEVPDRLDGLDGACDLVLMVSVSQYVPKDQLPDLLRQLGLLLKPGGILVIGDILDPSNGILDDVSALLRFGLRDGFLWDALVGLVKTLRSSYRRERQRLGLSTYTEDEIMAVLRRAGFTGAALGWNIGHACHRRSVVARRLPP